VKVLNTRMKSSSPIRISLALLILAVVSPGHARADDWMNPYTGNHWNNPTSDLLDTMIRDQMNADMLRNSLAKHGTTGTTGTTGTPGTPAPAPVKHLSYTKTDFAPAKKRLVVDSIIASLAQTPEQRTALGTGVGQVFVAFEKEARKNNVAYALAFMVAASISVSQGVTMTDDQTVDLAASINDILGQTPAFTKAKAADRQKLYETFVTLGGLIMIFDQVGKQGDADSAKAAKALATQALAMLGVKG
jgi:hypothetical protein